MNLVLNGVTQTVVNWSEFGNAMNNPKAAIKGAIQDAMAEQIKHATVFLLQLAPSVLLVVCMASILGLMIGSERCRHYASVSAISALVLQAVSGLV